MGASLHKIETLFHEALELPPGERDAFLESACGGDSVLREKIESLLRHYSEQTATFQAAVRPVASDLVATASMDRGFESGAMMGPYRVEHKIGEGGMGSVYLATDTRLARQVALKVILPSAGQTPEARARFVREARSAAALCHANIATLHDLGETHGTLWLVMEYVPGSPLRSRLTGSLGETVWLRYARQIAAALEHAHEHRIIHRDIKAENILITGSDQVKMIDFGLARVSQEHSDASGITNPRGFVGTLACAAPELLAGGAASPRSDVYSTGIVFYEMACGGHPFANLRGPALVTAILSGSYVSCRTANPQIPTAVATLIDRCMAREPAVRYKDGGELAVGLHRLAEGREIEPSHRPVPVLAVMDFINIGHSSDLDWLGAGIAETLSADLAKLRGVRVASRSRVIQTVNRLNRPQNDPSAIESARELGARWIVTGAYQRIGGHLRVTTAIVDAETGNALAAEKVDGNWRDLFVLQDRIAGLVAKALTAHSNVTGQQAILPAETRDLAAYEHYVMARRQMNEMQGQSLGIAIQEFEQAIALDPNYALAYSGLGTAHALQFLRTGNPQDIRQAGAYLERATELDPELGEPYPWLCNIRIRKNDVAGSFAAGRKGVELQPDLPESHYFCGGAHYLVPEFQPGTVRSTPSYLVEAIRLEPRFHAAWLVLGASVGFLGKHREAIEVLKEAVRLEPEPDIVYRFVGARTLLATIQTRSGNWEAGRVTHVDSIESLRHTDHVYGTCFKILSVCGLGEIALRWGDEDSAAAHFRHARRIIREFPRTTGSARLIVRINAGLAAAYAAAGRSDRAGQLADEAAMELEGVASQPANATFECSLAQLWLCLTVAKLRLGDLAAATRCLAKARRLGWMDLTWLGIDPLLRPLHGSSEFSAFCEELVSGPEVQIPVPAIPAKVSTAG